MNAVSSWLPIKMPDSACLTLFCLPFAGAGANIFLPWLDVFGPKIRVCPVEYPGRARRYAEPMPVDLGDLVDAILDGIGSLLPEKYAYFGHSMGGLLAYEPARRSRASSIPLPQAIVVSSWAAPSSLQALRKRHLLNDEAFIHELRAMGGTPDEILSNQKLLPFILPIARADFALIEKWRSPPAAPLPLPIHVLGGDNDPEVLVHALQQWQNHTTAGMSLDVLSGGHFCVYEQKTTTGTIVRGYLNQAIEQNHCD